jgi:hypothetical protein
MLVPLLSWAIAELGVGLTLAACLLLGLVAVGIMGFGEGGAYFNVCNSLAVESKTIFPSAESKLWLARPQKAD